MLRMKRIRNRVPRIPKGFKPVEVVSLSCSIDRITERRKDIELKPERRYWLKFIPISNEFICCACLDYCQTRPSWSFPNWDQAPGPDRLEMCHRCAKNRSEVLFEYNELVKSYR